MLIQININETFLGYWTDRVHIAWMDYNIL